MAGTELPGGGGVFGVGRGGGNCLALHSHLI